MPQLSPHFVLLLPSPRIPLEPENVSRPAASLLESPPLLTAQGFLVFRGALKPLPTAVLDLQRSYVGVVDV